MTTSLIPTSASAAWESYQRMRVRLAGRLNRELSQKTGLSESEFDVLNALEQAETESVRAIELRCGLEWEKSRLSHQLRRMEQRGLVVRSECAEDNRGSDVTITRLGRETVAQARQVHDEAVRRYVLDILTEEQIEQLGHISDAILGPLTEPHQA